MQQFVSIVRHSILHVSSSAALKYLKNDSLLPFLFVRNEKIRGLFRVAQGNSIKNIIEIFFFLQAFVWKGRNKTWAEHLDIMQ